MSLLSEIFEQPTILKGLLASMPQVEAIARDLHTTPFEYIFLAARGTSDNAGRYAQYLWGSHNRLPMALAAPSLFSIYQTPPLLKGALVIGVSQAGESPDILSVIEEGKRQGRPTLAITNAAASPLAQAADYVIDVQAGPERAVAASKSFTAQLMALAMLSLAFGGSSPAYHERLEALSKIPEWAEQALTLDEQIERIAQRFRYMEQCVVLGRGYNYATAHEWSLKMKELSYVAAEPYSSADFLHGPVAVVQRGYPVMAVAPGGAVFEHMLALLTQLHEEKQAELLVISDMPEVLERADLPIPLPYGIPEWLTPIVAIIPAQLFSYHLTQAKGLDTEAPRGLKKVTLTE
jgi:glucosamine--fructose-6-phosphate aminotransferase (isomerizing)